MNCKTLLAALAVLPFWLAPGLTLADPESHRQSVETLFRLTRMEQKISDSINNVAQLQLQTFTEQELDTMNAFYITPTGQKVITIAPQLVQQRNQLAMQRLQKNIGELQQIMSEETTRK